MQLARPLSRAPSPGRARGEWQPNAGLFSPRRRCRGRQSHVAATYWLPRRRCHRGAACPPAPPPPISNSTSRTRLALALRARLAATPLRAPPRTPQRRRRPRRRCDAQAAPRIRCRPDANLTSRQVWERRPFGAAEGWRNKLREKPAAQRHGSRGGTSRLDALVPLAL